MIAFDATGNVRWSVPGEQPQIATEDGGVIGQSGITYDQNGNATGQMGASLTQSWTGNEYSSSGSAASIITPTVYPDAASFWPQAGGNPSENGTAFVQCPCLLQSAGTAPALPSASNTIPAANRPAFQPAGSGAPLKTYVILEGDPGLNLGEGRNHNVGALFHLAALTEQDSLNLQGNLAGSPIRVSSVQDFAAQLVGNGRITGGVVYFGHGARSAYTRGSDETSKLAPGEQAGLDTNVESFNVDKLYSTQMDEAATVTLHACFAGWQRGWRHSIAQIIADRLQRRVYAPLAGSFFAIDPNSKLSGKTAPTISSPQKPIYLLPDSGGNLTCFQPQPGLLGKTTCQ